jgi:hypothetical protein
LQLLSPISANSGKAQRRQTSLVIFAPLTSLRMLPMMMALFDWGSRVQESIIYHYRVLEKPGGGAGGGGLRSRGENGEFMR